MSIEIPHDLIKQVQAAVLREVNLSSYDPNDASLSKQFPSIESSISELDPSPPHLRCKHCNGRLLRGTQSLLCVFCGKQIVQLEDPPEPIHFKTTFGCSWLLNSLNLDGSEIVGQPLKANESNRGRIVSEEELRFSNFIDLEVKWNSKFETLGIKNDKSFLSLVGVDFDDFLGERKVDTVSAVPEERSLSQVNENDDGSGINDFQVRDDFSSLGNVGRFGTVMKSTEEDDKGGGDSFTGWEASFQSAGSITSHEESKSVDPVMESSADLFEESKSVDPVVESSVDLFEESKSVVPVVESSVDLFEVSKSVDTAVESSVDLSAHMDAVFGSGNSLFDGKGKENVVSSSSNISDWFHDEVTANMKDGGTAEIANTSSMSIDWIHDDQMQIKSDKAPNNDTVDEEDESFDDAWNDFTSSTSSENPSNKQNDQAKQFEVTAVVKVSGKVENTNNSSLTSIDNKAADSKSLDEKDDSFDDWNDFASSTSTKDPSSGPSVGPAKQFEWNANVRDEKTEENANSSSSMNADWFQDNQWQTNSNKASDSKTIEMDVDLFDAWNDFSSSSAAQDSSKKQSGQAKQPEVTTTIKDNEMVENVNNSASISWTQDDQWSTSTNKTLDNKSIDDRNDLFDTWNDFTSSTNAQDSLNKQTGQAKQFEMTANVKDDGIMGVNNSSFDWFQGNQLQTGITTAPDKKTIDEVYDPFDTWNDFTSSSSAQDLSNKQSVNHMMPSVEQTAKNNLQDFDFGGFSQPQVSPGLLKDLNGSTEVKIMTSEPSVSDRISDVNAKDNDVPTATARSTTDNVEMLISQMHDLSFMLESNLSIPEKQDEFHSFSKG
ncbi:hypothetical protein LWI29_017696 [Acer saccharum]|uniref:DUF7815 domain-containing protein n=1 Tax=Acer saccharum TaxID=4024 RepID=A0AA39SD20_ACESA|nr:hypothetical protein LWI29_017696 [Acer saccharum]